MACEGRVDDCAGSLNESGVFYSEFATGHSNEVNQVFPRNAVSTIDMYEERLHDMTASYSEISFDTIASLQDGPLAGNSLLSSPANLALDCPGNPTECSLPLKSDEVTEDGNRRPDRLDLCFLSSDDGLENLHQAFGNLCLEGTVTTEGDLVSFVTEDLEAKIKLSSPISKKNDTPLFPSSLISTPCLYRQALMPQLPFINQTVLNELEVEVRKIATSVDTLTENLAGILHSVSALTVDCLETYRDAVCKTCDAVDTNIKSMYQLMAKCEELSKSMKPLYKLAEQIKGVKRLLDLFDSAVNS